MRKFPTGKYGRQTLEFFPSPHKAPLRAFISLVFCWQQDQVLLCDIEDRGWCIPSGRVEPGETSCQAARREALEEGGVLLEQPIYIGCYRMSDKNAVRWADVFTARVEKLVEITCTEESHGRKLICPSKLPQEYHLWNPLVEQIFELSHEVIRRHDLLNLD
ncbi:NUDIX domain-containing protein [Accumulibacter sp.]|uniref:NUDIX domain-containing protein n=1 Tax=Accumulibacter sp. TaxID=2053492 RepID=UPI001AC6B547|nr:NUDIX domain-containing protein [Accumulibacter sp.]MBN8452760.1 NUDIX domain-containing protein [Accumulibacter sp.]